MKHIIIITIVIIIIIILWQTHISTKKQITVITEIQDGIESHNREWEDILKETSPNLVICYNINQVSRIEEVFLSYESPF